MIDYIRNTGAPYFEVTTSQDYTPQGKYTFRMKLGGKRGSTLDKTTNIVASSLNTIKVSFTTDELDSLALGVYRMELYAINAADTSNVEPIYIGPFRLGPGLL